jgi:hypothetical protein
VTPRTQSLVSTPDLSATGADDHATSILAATAADGEPVAGRRSCLLAWKMTNVLNAKIRIFGAF